MARWLVSQGDRQFTAQDLGELKRLAASGQLTAGDMVQPPGAADWLYASEIPELEGSFSSGGGGGYDDDLDYKSGGNRAPLMALLLVLILGGGYAAWHFAQKIPEAGELDLLGESGLAMSEMLVTQANAPVYNKPDGSSTGNLDKDAVVELLGKRGEWYNVRAKESGVEGYVKYDHVVPAYFFADRRERENYDPLYNPDRYVFVKNSSWLQIDEQNRNLTIFQFMLQNKSKFTMTDIALLATIKDKNGRELETVEIPIEGVIPPYEYVMVGTLNPETKNSDELPRSMTTKSFEELAEEDEDLRLLWSDGVEVEMESEGFTEANIDILELRAVPSNSNG